MSTTERIKVDTPLVSLQPLPGEPVLVAVPYYADYTKPNTAYTVDGTHWQAGADPLDLAADSSESSQPNQAVWTGDRFIYLLYNGYDFSPMLVSRDGKAWTRQPTDFFTVSATVYGAVADGEGLVVIGGSSLGPDDEFYLVYSTDYGDTWAELPGYDGFTGSDSPYGLALVGDTLIIAGNSAIYTTNDRGLNWGRAEYPGKPVGAAAVGETNFSFSPYCCAAASGTVYIGGYSFGYHKVSTGFYNVVPVPFRLDAIIRSRDFVNWGGVETWWSTQPNDGSQSGTVDAIAASPDGKRILAAGSSQYDFSVLIGSIDGGETWHEVGNANDAPDPLGDPNPVGVFDPSWNLDLYLGIAYAFDQWYLSNYESPPDVTDPPIIVGAADFSTWEAATVPFTSNQYLVIGSLATNGIT